jgi:hypothetical protein
MCYICMYVINYPLLDACKILHEDGSDYYILKMMVVADLQIVVGPAEN